MQTPDLTVPRVPADIIHVITRGLAVKTSICAIILLLCSGSSAMLRVPSAAAAVGSTSSTIGNSRYRCSAGWRLARSSGGYVCKHGRAKRTPACRSGYTRTRLRAGAAVCRRREPAAPKPPVSTTPHPPQPAPTPIPPPVLVPQPTPTPPPAPVRDFKAQLSRNLNDGNTYAAGARQCVYGSSGGLAWSSCVTDAQVAA